MVFDYIERYPHRTKQILWISYQQLQLLLECAIKSHKEIKTELQKQKTRINAPGGTNMFMLVLFKTNADISSIRNVVWDIQD